MAEVPKREGSAELVRSADGRVPVAHSIMEEKLFLLTVRCPCGGGPFEKVSQAVSREGVRTVDHIRARCPRCKREREFRFDVSSFFGRFYPRRGVSDTTEPSQLLDAVAWTRWARLYLRAFEGERCGLSGEDRVDCGVLALRCLDEALKLFRSGEPALFEADLFTPGSREALAEAPARYGRYELIGTKLVVSMLLASSGMDPDGGDPGVAHQGVVRLVDAMKRVAQEPPPETEIAGGSEAPLPAPASLAPVLPVPLLPAPAPPRRRTLTWLAIGMGIGAGIGLLLHLIKS